jgi:hypothetical protein
VDVMKLALTAVAIVVLATPTAQADDAAPVGLEVIPLHYRMASELVPALLPLVEGRGAVMGSGDQIFIRATLDARHDVKAMVSLLDVQPRPLRVAVRQVFDRRPADTARAADGRSGRVVASLVGSAPGVSGGEQAEKGREASETAIRIRRDPADKRLARFTTDDEPAIQDDWYYATIGPRAALIPHLLDGDHVLVDVVTRRPGPATTDGELRTSVEGRVGDWIDITRVLDEHAWRRSGPQDEARREGRADSAVLVQVLRVPSVDSLR